MAIIHDDQIIYGRQGCWEKPAWGVDRQEGGDTDKTDVSRFLLKKMLYADQHGVPRDDLSRKRVQNTLKTIW